MQPDPAPTGAIDPLPARAPDGRLALRVAGLDRRLEEISVEIFNGCAGTCTGCLLSLDARRTTAIQMEPPAFAVVARALAAHARAIGFRFRVVLSFGDVVLLPPAQLAAVLGHARAAGLTLSATMTLASDGAEAEARYRVNTQALLDHDPDAIFDITVDPVRLQRHPGYRARLHAFGLRAVETRFNMLLSAAVMAQFTPQALAALWVERIGPQHAVILSFTPALAMMERRNSRYGVDTAAAYARAFYAALPAADAQNRFDLARYRSAGPFAGLLMQRFHIAADLSVYPPSYSAFGEITLDARNGQVPLGTVQEGVALADLLSGPAAARLSVLNDVWMGRGRFGCETCRFREGCRFNGVGLARRLYRDHEDKLGACYGPAALVAADDDLAA